jgi:hypothetical protein
MKTMLTMVLIAGGLASALAQEPYRSPRTDAERSAMQADPSEIQALTPAQTAQVAQWVRSVLSFSLSPRFNLKEDNRHVFGLDIDTETQELPWGPQKTVVVKTTSTTWHPGTRTIPLMRYGGVQFMELRGNMGHGYGLGNVVREFTWAMVPDKSRLCIQESELRKVIDEAKPFEWKASPHLWPSNSMSREDIAEIRRRGGATGDIHATFQMSNEDYRRISFSFFNWRCLAQVHLRVIFLNGKA